MAPEAWRGALPIPYRIGAGPGEGAPQGRVQLGHEAALRRHREDPRLDVSGRMDRPRQPPRRVGERRERSGQRHGAGARGGARARRAAQAGLGAEADHRLRGVGRRGAGAARLDRVGRDARSRSAGTCRRVHQHRRQRPRVSQRERLAFARAVRQRRRARHQRSRDRHQRLEAAAGATIVAKGTADERKDARERADLRIDALGSGSDYTPFLQHAGIASINLSFGDEDEDGIYHSIYDDFYFYTHFLDTDFAYGRALAQTVGTAVIRLADADVLPFEFTNLADTVQKYGRELKDLLSQKQDDDPRAQPPDRRRRVRRDARSEAGPCRRRRSRPCRRRSTSRRSTTPPPRWPTARAATTGRSAHRDRRLVGQCRARCARSTRSCGSAESQLVDAAGLPRRGWYRHLLYAPGFYTGYGVKTVPGVREGIEQARYDEAESRGRSRRRGRLRGWPRSSTRRRRIWKGWRSRAGPYLIAKDPSGSCSL